MKEEMPSYERITKLVVRSLLEVGFAAFVIFKLWCVDISLENFNYSFFLSTLIAFFAIFLSVLFYFKSTEQSNQFYNNIFSFTKDTSVLLAEMKKGIGHLENEVYKGHSVSEEEKNKEQEKLEKENKDISEKKDKIDSQISKTLEEKLNDKSEVETLKKNLLNEAKKFLELEREKDELEKELNRLKGPSPIELRERVYDYIRFRLVQESSFSRENFMSARFSDVRKQLNDVVEKYLDNREFRRDAQEIGLVDKFGEIRDLGLRRLYRYIKDNI